MSYPFIATFPKAAVASICALQTTAGAASLVINGTLATAKNAGGASIPASVTLPLLQTVVTLTSTADLSGVNFTIAGVDNQGVAVTATRAGPNNNTVATTAQYHVITSVTVDGAVGTSVSVGTGTVGTTAWFKVDRFQNPASIGIANVITATASWTVNYTYDNIETVTSPTVFAIPALTAIASTLDGTLGVPAQAIQGVMNSSSGNGACTMTISQTAGAK